MAALVAEGHDVLALCVDHGLQDGSRAQAERAAEQARTLGARAQVLSVEAGAGAAAGRSRWRRPRGRRGIEHGRRVRRRRFRGGRGAYGR